MLTEANIRQELETRHRVGHYSKEALDLMFEKAWDDGHAHGLQAVADEYDDLVQIAEAVWWAP